MYTIHDHGADLLVIGAVDIVLRNGRQFTQEFAQNFLLEDNQLSGPNSPAQEGGENRRLIRKFQAWIVSAVAVIQTKCEWKCSRLTHSVQDSIVLARAIFGEEG